MTSKAAFETLQTNDYGTNYHTKWRTVCGATQTGKKKLFPASSPTDRKPNKAISTLRTSVGEFVFRQTPLGCYLELVVGNARWALGLFGTNEAAVRALKKRQDGFPHVGCAGTQDRCQSNRHAEPLEQRRADAMNDSSF
jgi:hypothetical protein